MPHLLRLRIRSRFYAKVARAVRSTVILEETILQEKFYLVIIYSDPNLTQTQIFTLDLTPNPNLT